MSFQVPFSSSPAPSTPDKRPSNGSRLFAGLSTTPAGPPPSSAASFTPQGEPPPSSIFGSSMAETGPVSNPFASFKFNKSSNLDGFKSINAPSSPPAFPTFSPMPAAPTSTLFSNPGPSRFQVPDDEYDDEDAMGDDDDEEYEDEDGEGVEMDEDGDGEYTQELPAFKESRASDVGLRDSLRDDPPLEKQSTYGLLAKDWYTRAGPTRLHESADVILGTEQIMQRLYEDGLGEVDDDERLQRALSLVPHELVRLWGEYATATAAHQTGEYSATIGPGSQASGFASANFLASLVLPLYQPPARDLFDERVGNFQSLVLRQDVNLKSVSEILLDWMDANHNPYPSQLSELKAHQPSPAHHRLFWNILFNNLLRGRVEAVAIILKHAGWQHARLSLDEAREALHADGYSGQTLEVVQQVVGDAINILHHSPPMQGNWDVGSSEWILFRLRTNGARENLRVLAEGRDATDASAPMQAENFGLMSGSQSFSQRAKKAGSRVPWDIYQSLMTLYGILMGDATAIIANAEDWCEATVGLLVWGSESKEPRRPSVGHSSYAPLATTSRYSRDMHGLAQSFRRATSQLSDFKLNTLNPIEIALAAAFEGDTEHVVGFLRAWSGPIASAISEVASLGGWLPRAEPQSLIAMESMGLDQDDLALLGVGGQSPKRDSVKDQTLIAYAQSLNGAGTLETKSLALPKMRREGWELAIQIVGRLDSAPRAEDVVRDLLHHISLDAATDVDRAWRQLTALGMTALAEQHAETYADQVAEDTHRYGEALWYYALAHTSAKVRDVLNLLISFSLIHSTSFPAEKDMDGHLRRLVCAPQETLTELSQMDQEAALLLHKMLSGYGTLRKFYDVRDEDAPHGGRTVARKRRAATALMAVIASSDDNIRGGLYDESRGAVVSVDFLLALLGEALVFVRQGDVLLTAGQMQVLLKTLEDVQTVSARIYTDCVEFFETVLASAQGRKGSTPHDLLKKSGSSLSGTSSFSMVSSSMFASQLQRSMGSSGVLVKGQVQRGWDWRQALLAGTTADDVLRMLRLGLAHDLGRVWLLEADGQL